MTTTEDTTDAATSATESKIIPGSPLFERAQRFFLRLVHEGDTSHIDAPDFAEHYLFNGASETLAEIRQFCQAFVDYYDGERTLTILPNSFYTENSVVLFWNFSGCHKSTMQVFASPGVNVLQYTLIDKGTKDERMQCTSNWQQQENDSVVKVVLS